MIKPRFLNLGKILLMYSSHLPLGVPNGLDIQLGTNSFLAPSSQQSPALPAAATAAPAPTRTFRRLTSAEQLDRRRKGLCFNCDEPYTSGHKCAHLFYLETVDDAEVEALTAELDATTLSEAGVTTYGPVDATAFVISLHAMAGIKTAKTMLLPVTIHGERLTALVDTGSTHNFLSRDTMRRLTLQPAGAEKFSVTVANGDHLASQGVAQQVLVLIGDEPFSINCVGIDLGCYDFILGVDFLSTLGPILWDLDVLSLIFWREGGRRVQWTGIGGSGAATPQLQDAINDVDHAIEFASLSCTPYTTPSPPKAARTSSPFTSGRNLTGDLPEP
jgi:hypothetical protein